MDLIGWIVVFILACLISVLFYRITVLHYNEKKIVELIGLLVQREELKETAKKGE